MKQTKSTWKKENGDILFQEQLFDCELPPVKRLIMYNGRDYEVKSVKQVFNPPGGINYNEITLGSVSKPADEWITLEVTKGRARRICQITVRRSDVKSIHNDLLLIEREFYKPVDRQKVVDILNNK